MNAYDQHRLLRRIEDALANALSAARQLPGHQPLTTKLHDAYLTATAWRSDQEAELPETLETYER